MTTTITSDRIVTTIAQDQELITLINIFKVEPENQQQLIDLLIDATEEVMCKLPGFISANVHKSLDGTRVTNYAQWRSIDDFRAIFNTPEATAHMPAIGKIAESEPTLYEVSYMKQA
ncbi:antibiotic biosynthesis monooxygenase [Phormidesmis priestleyi ULC007]|uniref:Antibiotic biosynthesis monooxygenase n=1 Tax=Phormidesmis priestleyi ULC007 TaxID=1920490 RepID=A0A2T1DN92_9CYAN|nr:antibiotic biosynthesis monooxygenase family protein [Phormidesmis priestleyi]PSB21925.1 antibiotic biosynthesis monooxygenase [Phormidesmis priestleyi ULC007]PZO46745.1 MAG: antibiotic biosynthesis monooxygenase [Phormidesmis priestleyi]